jgi:hypothetical protein
MHRGEVVAYNDIHHEPPWTFRSCAIGPGAVFFHTL